MTIKIEIKNEKWQEVWRGDHKELNWIKYPPSQRNISWRLRKVSEVIENEETKKRFKRLAKVASRFFQEKI